MAQLTVRQVDDELVRELKLRAARHGRSAEAEIREILRNALRSPEPRMPFLDFLAAMPCDLSDEEIGRSDELPRDVDP